MAKVIKHTKLSDTLAITLCNDGYWLYDKLRGMNLAMHAQTEQEAFTEALTYYQERCKRAEAELDSLQVKINGFINQFNLEVEW